VAQLEAVAPPVGGSSLEGIWELVYSDVAPFRASPFFMTVGAPYGLLHDGCVCMDIYVPSGPRPFFMTVGGLYGRAVLGCGGEGWGMYGWVWGGIRGG
jgi:hypothetical protein